MSHESAPGKAPRALWWFLAAFLTLQVVAPAMYYLGDYREDERFAWRMFSTIRMARCTAEAREHSPDAPDREIDLEAEIHAAWITHIERNRALVIGDFLAGRCNGEVDRLVLENTCTAPDDEKTRWRWIHDCAADELSREAVAWSD